MTKTILITGATDGIGLEAAKMLSEQGHRLILHGRNPKKLAATGLPESHQRVIADLSDLAQVQEMAKAVSANQEHLDVLINNAGVLATRTPRLPSGHDIRFVVNTLAPVLLAERLLPLMNGSGRILNLSSAAQAPVDVMAIRGKGELSDFEAYAQSKLALTMWSQDLAERLGPAGPTVIAVNPGSMLGTKMVQEAFGRKGADIGIGAKILCELGLNEKFADASGKYFDNDAGRIAPAHVDTLDAAKVSKVVQAVRDALGELSAPI